MKKILSIVASLGICLISLSSIAQENAELTQAKFERIAQGIVLQLYFSGGSTVTSFAKTLPAAPGGYTRYYIDLSPLKLSYRFQQPVLTSDPEIKQIRWAQHEKDKVRIVFDLLHAEAATQFRIEKNTEGLAVLTAKPEPSVAVVEATTESTQALPKEIVTPAPKELPATVNIQPTMQPTVEKKVAKEEKAPVPADKKQTKYRIILDAGHGGDDPGARGKKGTLEKNVTLEVALKTKKILQRNPAYEIFMTREKDTTLQLLDRTKFANRMNGDLFVSIHANASPKRTSKGVSTYFLNNADDQESLRVAMRENGELDPEVLGQASKNSEEYYLEVMKASMVKNFHTTQSTDLARAVQLDLLKTLRKNYSDIVDLGVRSARFYVLTGAAMPAILVETSFISHPEEEKRLANSKYQENLAYAVVSGIESFLKNRPVFDSNHGVYLSEETSSKKRSTSKRN